MDNSGPGSFVLGIFQARIREQVAISFSRGSSWPMDETCVSCIGGQIITQPSGKTNFLHCCCSVSQSCPTLCDHMDYSTPDLPVPHCLPKFAQVHVHCMVIASSHLILWRPFLLLPSIFPSIRDFSSKLAVSIKWPKYWSFRFSISPSNGNSGLISLKIDWFDLCCPRDFQESSPAPQFRGINSLVSCLFHSPALTNICDYWAIREAHFFPYRHLIAPESFL